MFLFSANLQQLCYLIGLNLVHQFERPGDSTDSATQDISTCEADLNMKTTKKINQLERFSRSSQFKDSWKKIKRKLNRVSLTWLCVWQLVKTTHFMFQQ